MLVRVCLCLRLRLCENKIIKQFVLDKFYFVASREVGIEEKTGWLGNDDDGKGCGENGRKKKEETKTGDGTELNGK